MRVGVTGSSGLIGRALVAALSARGDEPIRFVRSTSASSDATSIRWNPSAGEIDDGDLVRVGGFDAVVNLAGAGVGDRRWTDMRKQEILQSRLNATSLLVATLNALPSPPAILASASAIGFYGSRSDEVLDETSSGGEDFLASVCRAWEAAASLAHSPVAFLRTGVVMSEHGGALKKMLPLFRLGLGGKLSKGDQWLSPISLRDEVAAILWILDHRLIGPVNLVAPEPITNRDFTTLLARQLHRPAILAVPTIALTVALGAEAAHGLALTSQRVVPRVLSEHGFPFADPSAASILAHVLSS